MANRIGNRREFTYLAILLTISVVVYITLLNAPETQRYGDENIYIDCGRSYLSGIAPKDCNFEHPPLGKYISGLAISTGIGRYMLLLFYTLSVLALYKLASILTNSIDIGFASSLLFALDTLTLNVYRYFLLDVFSVTFMLIALYMLYRDGNPLMIGVFTGLAIASKLSVLPIIAIAIITKMLRRPRRLVTVVFIALAIYISTYVIDVARYGPMGVIEHHIEMIKYLSYRHGFTVPKAINGILMLYTKAEVWRYGGTIYATIINNTIVNQTIIKELGRELWIEILVGCGSILWYLNLPITMITTYRTLTRNIYRELTLLIWASLTTVLPGPIDWYYINTTPFLYTAMGTNRKAIYIMIAIQITWLTLTRIGVVPWRTILMHR